MPSKFDRRSFIAKTGATVGLGALGIVLGGGAKAYAQSGSDSDAEDRNQPAGTVPAETDEPDSLTDADTGPLADPEGYGRGVRSGISDSDSGANADPAGLPRGARGHFRPMPPPDDESDDPLDIRTRDPN